jgi:hypothetical protein
MVLTVVVDGSRRSIALSVQTTGGAAPASPVLVRQSNPNHRVIFGDESPSHFARKRCEEIGCPTDVVHDAERGCAAPLAQSPASVLLSDDQALTWLIKGAARGRADQSQSGS